MGRTNRIFIQLAGIVMAAGLMAAPTARASDIDRLLDLLVKKNVVTQEEAAELRAQIGQEEVTPRAQALVEKPNPESAKKEHPVTGASRSKLSGWAQTRFTSGIGTTNNTLEIRRARLALDGNLTPKAAYRMQIDGARSPALIDARLDYTLRPFAKVTVGQFKIPFSQESLVSARDLIPIERSLVGNSLVPGRDTGSSGRDIGAQLAGKVTRSDGRPLFDYAVGVFNGAGISRRDDNRRKDGVARLVVHPFDGLSLGGNYYNGESGVTNISRERAGVELAYTRNLYSLRGEYIWGHDGPVRKYGWYSQFAYKFRPKWEALARFDKFDPRRRAGDDVTNTYLVGVNWYLSNWVKLQANYGLVDEEARTELTNLILSQVQFQF